MGFFCLKNEHFSVRKHIVDMDVVNYVTCTYQSVLTGVVI